MLGTIIKKEMLEQLISFRFLVLTAVCLIIIPLSLFVSWRSYTQSAANYRTEVQLQHERHSNAGGVNLLDSGFELYGYLPPSVLEVFAAGVDDRTPKAFSVRKTGLSFRADNFAEENTPSSSGRIDFMFIAEILLSLMAILFSFDTICGEKEGGTLKLLLANAISRDTYILGKFLGTLITLIAPFIAAFLLGLVMLLALGFPLFTGEIPIRIAGIVGITVLHVAIFCGIGFFVSAMIRTSKTAVIALISIWIVLTILIPKGSDIVAQGIFPIRSAEVVSLEKTLARENLELEKGARIDKLEKTLPQYDQYSPEKNMLVGEQRSQVLEPLREQYIRKIEESISRIDREYDQQKKHQRQIALVLAHLSPVTPFNRAIADLAWTGEERKASFATAADTYRETLNRELFRYIYKDITPSGRMSMGTTKNVDMKSLPEFTFSDPTLSKTIHTIRKDIFLLFLAAFLMVILVHNAFRRYDIR